MYDVVISGAGPSGSQCAEVLAKALNKGIKLPCKFEFKPTIQHRGVLVLRGGFSDNISNTDPEHISGKGDEFRFSVPLDDDENAKYTTNVLNDFLRAIK